VHTAKTANNMPSITAIIPTLSNTSGLKYLLNELEEANIPSVVIDNNLQERNLYFAAAVNLGAKQANTEWLLVANDDIEGVTKYKIASLIQVAEKNNWIAVSPILRSPQGNIENIGYRVLPIGRVELNFSPIRNSNKDLDGLTAACLLIKRKVFNMIGGFDESFVAYLEDVDIFLRLKKRRYEFGVATNVEVIHNHMVTSSKLRGFKEKRDFINWIKIILKNWDISTLQIYGAGIIVERFRNLYGYIKSGYLSKILIKVSK
jgi:GT2 family glycosyltransferase